MPAEAFASVFITISCSRLNLAECSQSESWYRLHAECFPSRRLYPPYPRCVAAQQRCHLRLLCFLAAVSKACRLAKFFCRRWTWTSWLGCRRAIHAATVAAPARVARHEPVNECFALFYNSPLIAVITCCYTFQLFCSILCAQHPSKLKKLLHIEENSTDMQQLPYLLQL